MAVQGQDEDSGVSDGEKVYLLLSLVPTCPSSAARALVVRAELWPWVSSKMV